MRLPLAEQSKPILNLDDDYTSIGIIDEVFTGIKGDIFGIISVGVKPFLSVKYMHVVSRKHAPASMNPNDDR